jgi:membrane fusion protein (multidrug efflux system)
MFKRSLISLVVLLMATLLSVHCGDKPLLRAEEGKDKISGIPVEAARVERGTISAQYSCSAPLEAESEAVIVAQVGGVVERIFVEEGDRVEANQVLAKLEDDLFELELSQAGAELEKLANDLERSKKLFKDDIISAEYFEEVKFKYTTQKATYKLAKLKFDYTSIRAPFKGVVTERMVKFGNMVQEKQQIFRIADFDPLLAVIHVPEREMSKLRIGFPAYLTADAFPGCRFTGKIVRISPVVNAKTGTFKVTLEVNDTTDKLKPGLFTRVHIVYDTHEDALLVPRAGIYSEDDVSWVYVVRNGGAFKRRVKVGYRNSSHVEVLSGLEADNVIVTSGLGGLKDGAVVEVMNRV